ncbi:MAG: glycosyltransferase [Acidimicrobiia bacterium]|nr:glycosyltransferase [Acidimicrobiia bacterium]
MTEAESGSGAESEKALRAALRRERQKRAELEDRAANLEAELAKQQRRTADLSNRRSVRMALRLAELVKPVVRLARRQPRGQDSTATTAGDLASRLSGILPTSGPTSGPLVSIVMVDRDGGHSRDRFLSGLRNSTAYRSFEVVLADCYPNEAAEPMTEDWGFPIRVVAGNAAMSYARAVNLCVAEATGEFVLLMRGDLAPISAGWLGALVADLQANPKRAAVAPVLVDLSPDPEQPIDAAVVAGYEKGAAFHLRRPTADTRPAPVTSSIGTTAAPSPEDFVDSQPVPALPLGCILSGTALVRELGAIDEGFVNGLEGVDLTLAMGQRGYEVAVVGQAALFRYRRAALGEKSAQPAAHSANTRRFAEKWDPLLSRSLLAAQLVPEDTGDQVPTTVAITTTRKDPAGGSSDWEVAHELGNALEADGYEVVLAEAHNDGWYEIGDDVSIVISLHADYDVRKAPSGALKLAWIHGATSDWMVQPWFRHYNVYVPGSQASAALLVAAGIAATEPLPLATNEQRFFPHPADPAFENDFAATANHHGSPRYGLEKAIVHAHERFSIYGRGWAAVPKLNRYSRGPVRYEDLPDVYASSKVIIDAATNSANTEGVLSAPIFDATATGALVLTDNAAGSEEIFAGELPVYEHEKHQRELLDQYLKDEALRLQTVQKLRRTVLDRHTYTRRVGDIRKAALTALSRPRIALKIGTPGRLASRFWGDTYFAEALAASLAGEGANPAIQYQSDWELPGSHSVDVVIHIRGLGTYVPKPAHKNILWIISHPEQVSETECEAYDLVLVASEPYADELRSRVAVPVEVMHQAARPDPSPPEPDAEIVTEVLFVGNTRGRPRRAIEHALAINAPLRVYGQGWDGILPESYWAGEHFPNERLGALYASAGVNLNDHWPDMARLGFISNRVFDIVAAGGIVFTDPVAGLETVFGDLIPTFDSAEQLQDLLDRLHDDRDGFAVRMQRAQDIVLQDHTFAARARRIMELIEEIEPRQPM